MIEVQGLRKQFGDLVAVDDVSFTANPGEIFGLLGPNGAGKSTTIGCFSGLIAPTAGRVRILGHDVLTEGPQSRRRLGVVPQELALYEELSATENLVYWGSAYGLRGSALKARVGAVLAEIGLGDRATGPVRQFSGGMKRRLNFGCAVVHEPKVLLLDEPTVGVDPQSRERLLDMVRNHAASGTCVLYTTHYMEEAETLCDRLAIIDHGRLIASGDMDELRGMMGEKDILRLAGEFEPGKVRDALSQHEGLGDDAGLEILNIDEAEIRLSLVTASMHLSALFHALQRGGAVVRETTLTRPNLEALFLKLTGRELRE